MYICEHQTLATSEIWAKTWKIYYFPYIPSTCRHIGARLVAPTDDRTAANNPSRACTAPSHTATVSTGRLCQPVVSVCRCVVGARVHRDLAAAGRRAVHILSGKQTLLRNWKYNILSNLWNKPTAPEITDQKIDIGIGYGIYYGNSCCAVLIKAFKFSFTPT